MTLIRPPKGSSEWQEDTLEWQEFLNGAPPLFDALVPRNVVDTWRAEWATNFGKISDDYVRYMTGLPHPYEETEELMSRWSRFPEYHYEQTFGDQIVHLGETDAGWLAQRSSAGHYLTDWRLLTHCFEIPVLFSSFPSAATLIERFFPDPPPPLIWNTRQ
jgi:hypothetical protein